MQAVLPLSNAHRGPHPSSESIEDLVRIDAGVSRRLRADRPRRLLVCAGAAWITRDGTLEQPADDVVLSEGGSISVAADESIVIESWCTRGVDVRWV